MNMENLISDVSLIATLIYMCAQFAEIEIAMELLDDFHLDEKMWLLGMHLSKPV